MRTNQVQGTYTGSGRVEYWSVDQDCNPIAHYYDREGDAIVTGLQFDSLISGILQMPEIVSGAMPFVGINLDGDVALQVDLGHTGSYYHCDMHVNARDETGDLVADVIELEPNEESFCLHYWNDVCNQMWVFASGELVGE
jgi:hypothetical protein